MCGPYILNKLTFVSSQEFHFRRAVFFKINFFCLLIINFQVKRAAVDGLKTRNNRPIL